MKTLTEQLDCAQRCLTQRQRSYPQLVKDKKMTPEKAKHEIDCMAEIVGTLERQVMLEEVSEEMKEMASK